MILNLNLALVGSSSSDAIVELLGVVAVIAFLGTIAFVAVVQLQDQVRKRSLPKLSLSRMAPAKQPAAPKALAEFDDGYQSDLKRAQDGYRAYYDSTVHAAKKKIEELLPCAAGGFRHLVDAYGQNSIGMEGERRAVRIARFEAVCERQWSHFKGELSYLGYQEVQENLRHILDVCGMKEPPAASPQADENSETTPEALRSLEVLRVLRAVPREKIEPLQTEMLEALGPFRDYYHKQVRDWINDRIFRLMGKLRERSEHGVTVADTDMKDKLTSLRARLEIVARLSEGLSENTHRLEDGAIALSQILYVGAVLHMLMQLSEWFPEVAPPIPVEEPTSNSQRAPEPAGPRR